jgi:hypothetical protein
MVQWLNRLLHSLHIYTPPEYRVTAVNRARRFEYEAEVHIYNGSRLLGIHTSPAVRGTRTEAIEDAAMAALTSLSFRNREYLLPTDLRFLPRREPGTRNMTCAHIPQTVSVQTLNNALEMMLDVTIQYNIALEEIDRLRTTLAAREKVLHSFDRYI